MKSIGVESVLEKIIGIFEKNTRLVGAGLITDLPVKSVLFPNTKVRMRIISKKRFLVKSGIRKEPNLFFLITKKEFIICLELYSLCSKFNVNLTFTLKNNLRLCF